MTDNPLRAALEIIAAPPTDAPDAIGVRARNIARAALAASATDEGPDDWTEINARFLSTRYRPSATDEPEA